MPILKSVIAPFLSCLCLIILSSCSTYTVAPGEGNEEERESLPADYASRLPQEISTTSKTVLVDPNVHAWGAYDASGSLEKAGLATAGSDYCPDLHRACHTLPGSYHVASLGSPDCKSRIFPIPRGGAPMPYCMYFHNGQALHGSPEGEVVEGNISHGCVRMHVSDAEWLRYNFVDIGTKVIVRPY